MPLKAGAGLSKKVGQENYDSLGANCQLEIELDNTLVNDAEAFREKIRRLYALANQAVDALQRRLAMHEPAGVDFSPVCLSQITGFYPYRSPRHFQKE